ncbi:DUF7523 family protein [Halapricum hydrolyticum]|uniref:Uncharacterized protein n=1 Tax=Halapricum hydrolyticum TaxID=2979991 RepID=A0AAE3ICQ7_9EURY|nr:hypothetical protein [Halapricum hydrolyticum]MCU4717623.1 hypothetical protein [Halapricum hydrolyticum]MCU4726848.1 hypothetical protein [Halapricum hydrolyticum]
MSLAADTRQAVRDHPFVYEGLRAGIVNYSAAARFLDVGETEAVAAALRRYAEELPEREDAACELRVTMYSGVGPVEDGEDPLLVVGETALAADGGDATAVVATGDAGPDLLRTVLGQCAASEIPVEAAAVSADALVLVVGRRDGPDVVRLLERHVET